MLILYFCNIFVHPILAPFNKPPQYFVTNAPLSMLCIFSPQHLTSILIAFSSGFLSTLWSFNWIFIVNLTYNLRYLLRKRRKAINKNFAVFTKQQNNVPAYLTKSSAACFEAPFKFKLCWFFVRNYIQKVVIKQM